MGFIKASVSLKYILLYRVTFHIYRLYPDILAPRDSRIHIDPEKRKCYQESFVELFYDRWYPILYKFSSTITDEMFECVFCHFVGLGLKRLTTTWPFNLHLLPVLKCCYNIILHFMPFFSFDFVIISGVHIISKRLVRREEQYQFRRECLILLNSSGNAF